MNHLAPSTETLATREPPTHVNYRLQPKRRRDVSPDDLARKYRLKYQVEVYFPGLKYADLHRRLAGQQPPDEARGLYRMPDELLLKPGEQWHGSYRTFASYFEEFKPSPPDAVVAAVCLALARAHLHSSSSNKDTYAKENTIKQSLFQ